MNKKGQAAMEFLMTYGWAILAAIIAIAVLAYFGVFNPGRYASEVCSLGPPFICSEQSAADSTIGANGGVTLILTNSGDESITISTIDLTNCLTGYVPPGTAEEADFATVGSGSEGTFDLECTLANAIDTGDTFRGNIEVTYQKPTTGDRDLTATGSITRKSAE